MPTARKTTARKSPPATTPATAKPAPAKPAPAKTTTAKAAPVPTPPVPKAGVKKVVAKPAAAAASPVKVAPVAKAEKVEKVDKAKPPKLRRKPVRDSFTMPEADFALIATLKARALSAKHVVKKSELLRAGLQALAALDTPALVAALGQLEPVKVGRPKKG